MPYGLTNEHFQDIATVLRSNSRVTQAILFGSRAKGTQRPGSDIDIALKGDELIFNDLLALSILLDELELPYQFDLLLYHHISEPALRAHIDRVGKLIVPIGHPEYQPL